MIWIKTQYVFRYFLAVLSIFFSACSSDNKSPELASYDNTQAIHVGLFSKSQKGLLMPEGWQELSLPGVEQHSEYSLVTVSNKRVIKAVSQNAASGIIKKVNIDPKQFPILKWCWKIENILKTADIKSKAGDDYSARIFVTFDYDIEKLSSNERFKAKMYSLLHGELPPLATINYIWDNRAALNSIQSSAYTDRVKMIVIQSGADNLKQWLTEKRNIYEDFKLAFGEEPPHVSSIAIMTDTDNTGEKATAYFGDITFYPQNSTPNQ
ncbi:hypothetical protein MNBD_GAMMA22-1697 [hydrothermal vent metagenome]|uniref:DUF3047 domain-containing protein n=1 Tax=hydrothermal vent metagenome TaxID=652676 RepID=A0A3B0ZNA0_9ZZZZ